MNMRRSLRIVGYLSTCLFGTCVFAQGIKATPSPHPPAGSSGTKVYQEYGQRMRSAQMVTPLSSDLFGENINLFDGQTEFSNVDISVPGNSDLPVQLRRRFSVIRDPGTGASNYGGVGEWDIDVPYISGVFPGDEEWSSTPSRCSSPYLPAVSLPFGARDVITGASVHIPGKGDSELFSLPGSGSSIFPADGEPHVWTTRNFDAFTCTSTLANTNPGAPGQGFVMTSSDGLKYTFNWMTKRDVGTLGFGANQISRTRVFLLATKVEDRYGNKVEYIYNARGLPDFIRGFVAGSNTPEREISLLYTGGGAGTRLVSATAHGRTWNYDYLDGLTVLQPASADIPAAQRPRWKYAAAGSLYVSPQPSWDGNGCDKVPADNGTFTLEITHPAGAKGTFDFVYKRFGRSGILRHLGCSSTKKGQRIQIPNFADGFALVKKTITGTGISAMEWNYHTGGGSAEPFCTNFPGDLCTEAPSERTVTVIEPDLSQKLYRFGIMFEVNYGRLLGTQTKTSAPAGLTLNSTTTTYYPTSPPANSFPNIYGYSWPGSDDYTSREIRPIISETETRQGVTFARTTPIADFDGYARPLKVVRSSTLPTTSGPTTRTETTVYKDNTTRWLLGSIESVTEQSTGAVMQYNTYDPTTLDRLTETRFGKLQGTMKYYADGTLEWVKDGRNKKTTLSNYKRGIPQRIEYADTKFQTAEVNDHGQITSITNEVDATTGYLYRGDGRLQQITYPSPDSTVWSATSVSFVPDGSNGRWKQVIQTGNGRKTTEFDAMWRPLLVVTQDISPSASISRYTAYSFDHAGRQTFVSYPRATQAGTTTGTWSTYDGLGRLRTSYADTEGDQAETTIDYPDFAFQKKVTNPRQFVTTTSYQAFDQPDDANVAVVVEPGTNSWDTVTTTIVRDIFGKPKTATRTGSELAGSPLAAVSAERRYIYDDNQRLCKTMEPESGNTVIEYDAADNVAWRAPVGPALASTTSCERPGVSASQKITYAYDDRNRRTATSFGDNSPAIITTYTDDGLPWTISSDYITWTYLYNKRRMLESEELAAGVNTYLVQHSYNANGHESVLAYPDGTTVNYAPNALGEATQALPYATGVTRHPNGAIANFKYANGVDHTGTQTSVRGFPEQSRDFFGSTNILKDFYTWDENGNVTSIASVDTPERPSRSMQYDARDRLSGTAIDKRLIPWDPDLAVALSFSYDALDNLRSYNTPFRLYTHFYDASNRLDEIRNSSSASMYKYSYNGVAGNRGVVTGRNQGAGYNVQNYTVGLDDRVRALTGPSSAWKTYKYDGLGRRTQIKRGSAETNTQVYTQAGKLLWGHILAEGASEGPQASRFTKYVYLGNHLIAREIDDELSPPPSDEALNYLHTDGLGSPVAATTPLGALVAGSRVVHEPYGLEANSLLREQGPGFTGHVVDSDTGLSYMQQRYYDPIAGRFLSPDPISTNPHNGTNFNRYWYANNNPYKFVDPDGRMSSFADHPSLRGGFTSIQVAAIAKRNEDNSMKAVGAAVDHARPKSTYVELGASAQGGTPAVGAAVQASGGVLNPSTRPGELPDALYYSGGFMVGGLAGDISAPTSEGSQYASGASTSGGPTFGISNARDMSQLVGSSLVTRIDSPVLSIQWSMSDSGIWTFGVSGPAIGLGVTQQEVFTRAAWVK